MGSAERVPRGLILAHGAGSTADFLARAFPAQQCGAQVHLIEDRTGSTEHVVWQLRKLVAELRGRYRQLFIGGVSIGAHAAAFAGLKGPVVEGYVFALPGWLGAVDPDGATARAADEIGALGAKKVLARLGAEPQLANDWVVAELTRAWANRPTLVAELAAAAAEPAPSALELAQLTGPALVLGLAEDPMHTLATARAWTELLPGSSLTVLPRQAPATDRSVFGAAVGQWLDRFSAPR